MKVLAGHPEGRASVADLKQYVAVLMCSGSDWSKRVKSLAARAPELDAFTSGYILRKPGEWRITEAGRDFLTSIELQAPKIDPTSKAPPSALPTISQNVIRIADYAGRRRDAA